MDNKFTEAMDYLTAPTDSFWKWDERGAVVIWLNGSTLAFREELAVVVGRLSTKGLPSIDAILILIAATRAYWAEDSLALKHRLQEYEKNFSNRMIQTFSEFFEDLDLIRDLPDELIRTASAKAELAANVFEISPCVVNSDIATAVYELLTQQLTYPKLFELPSERRQTNDTLLNDLWPLKIALKGVTKQALFLRQQTGLDAEPEPAPLEYVVDQSVMRGLLQELSMDEELGGLSRLARNLAAVVQLPRAISDSDELPLGGVSDLTNRGSLDRLLLSELAHDDLMLATRVALNEARYLRWKFRRVFLPNGVMCWSTRD